MDLPAVARGVLPARAWRSAGSSSTPRRLPSIEINGSFYSLQRPETTARGPTETPDDFVFAVKGGRFITHMKKLRGVEAPLANFFASGVLALGAEARAGALAAAADLGYDAERLAGFFAQLPRTTGGRRRAGRRGTTSGSTGRALTDDRRRPAAAARAGGAARTFATPASSTLLRAHDVALVVADTAGKWPALLDVTADHVYVRLHGDEELYVSGYADGRWTRWAARVAAAGATSGARRLRLLRQRREGARPVRRASADRAAGGRPTQNRMYAALR